MTLIPAVYLIAKLLTMGWDHSDAQLMTSQYRQYYNNTYWKTGHTYSAYFFPNQFKIEYGTHEPTAVSADHENQHAWYEYHNLDNINWISRDFQEMCRRKVQRACDVISANPVDGEIHWMHYLINYVGRDKMQIPEPYRSRYYGWMADPPKIEKRYTIRIPFSVRTR